MRIAVAGGTGEVGRHVVASARAGGHETVVLARSAGVDVLGGDGLEQALTGVEAVVDVLSVTTTKTAESRSFFSASTSSLLAAGKRAGVRHHLALSIVGIDRAPSGYYAGKLAQERLVEHGDVPWTIVRATQFHEFAAQMYDRLAVGPVHPAPQMRTQPIAAREVADHLIATLQDGPAGRVADLAGPREEDLVQMVRAYARARGRRGCIPAIPVPGAFGKAQRSGALLPGPEAVLGRQTFDQWLAELS